MHNTTNTFLAERNFKSIVFPAEIRDLALRAHASGPTSRVISLVLLALVCLLAWGCSGTASPQQKQGSGAAANRPVSVSVAKATLQDLPVYLTGLGSVTASNTVNVRSRVDGQLVTVTFKEGQPVRKGDLLAVIDPRPFEVQLSQTQAQLFKDQAQLHDAKLNLDRFTGLLPSGIISRQQIDSQQALANQLEGAVRADQAQVDNAKLQLSYCRITAPINGRIGLRLVDPGNMVHAADPNGLLVITQLEPIAVLFTLPEDNLPAVAKHLHQGPLQVEAYARDDQTRLATGTLLTIDNVIDPATGTGRLKGIFDNKDAALWPNQFVNARLLLEVRKNSIVIPNVAIQHGPQGAFVYVVRLDKGDKDKDKTAEVRPVSVALTQGNLASIASGVNPGELVVTDGQDKLQNGSKVEVQTGGSGPKNGAAPQSGTANSGTPAS